MRYDWYVIQRTEHGWVRTHGMAISRSAADNHKALLSMKNKYNTYKVVYRLDLGRYMDE